VPIPSCAEERSLPAIAETFRGGNTEATLDSAAASCYIRPVNNRRLEMGLFLPHFLAAADVWAAWSSGAISMALRDRLLAGLRFELAKIDLPPR
jgi:hypothetical protein